MQKWQKNRNYRRIRDEQGQVVANVITVDGMDVEVSEEVFLAYSQADRRERYIKEEVEPGSLLSWEKLLEDGVPLDSLGVEPVESAEEQIIVQQAEDMHEHMKQNLLLALRSLNDVDRELITALFFDRISTRAYAQHIGVTQRAIIKRRDRILRKMKKFLEKFLD